VHDNYEDEKSSPTKSKSSLQRSTRNDQMCIKQLEQKLDMIMENMKTLRPMQNNACMPLIMQPNNSNEVNRQLVNCAPHTLVESDENCHNVVNPNGHHIGSQACYPQRGFQNGHNSRIVRKFNRQKVDKNQCRNCMNYGHYARDCPYNETTVKSTDWSVDAPCFVPSNSLKDAPQATALNIIQNSGSEFETYLQGYVNSRKCFILLDTGCETSVIARNLIPEVTVSY
jgi:hypothetical protein